MNQRLLVCGILLGASLSIIGCGGTGDATSDIHSTSGAIGADPDFTCPSRSVCFFSNTELTGTACAVATDAPPSGPWQTVDAWCGFHSSQSVHNNSGSAVRVLDKATGWATCIQPGGELLDLSPHPVGYFQIDYGEHC